MPKSFHEPADYSAFINLMRRAQERLDLPILGACLMPNHVHLVVRPTSDNDIAAWTRWLFTTHVRHYHEKYGTTGRLWQGRYKSFLIQDDHYLLTVLRYVERNAARANLVERAEDWHWGSSQLADCGFLRTRSYALDDAAHPVALELASVGQH